MAGRRTTASLPATASACGSSPVQPHATPAANGNTPEHRARAGQCSGRKNAPRGAHSAVQGGQWARTRRPPRFVEQVMLSVLARAGLIFLAGHLVFLSLALLLAS